MNGDHDGSTPMSERARSSSWGGPEARAELRRIADEARLRAGFSVSIVDVLRGDGFLEPVAFAGPRVHEADMGQSYPVSHMRRVAEAGTSYGTTDDLGFKAVDQVTTIYDLHATILHLLGLDHERLSFYHNGIERRLTDVHGEVVRGVLS